MNNADYWNIFELTGCISDYLNYACASEERQELEWEKDKKEGGQADESGNSNGNGFISHAHWRIR